MALSFNGTNQYINITQTSGLPLYKNNTTYSICGWVKAAAQGYSMIFSEAKSTSIYAFVGWGSGLFDTSKFIVRLINDSNTVILSKESTTTVFDNTWHHFCWVDNNGTATLYIDGVADATNFNYTRSGSFNEDNSIIGTIYYYYQSNYLTGILFDIRCYNRCLTANEIAEIYHRRGADKIWQGLVGWWRLDEKPTGQTASGGSSVIDLSGNGNHGTPYNSPVYQASPHRLRRGVLVS